MISKFEPTCDDWDTAPALLEAFANSFRNGVIESLIKLDPSAIGIPFRDGYD